MEVEDRMLRLDYKAEGLDHTGKEYEVFKKIIIIIIW